MKVLWITDDGGAVVRMTQCETALVRGLASSINGARSRQLAAKRVKEFRKRKG